MCKGQSHSTTRPRKIRKEHGSHRSGLVAFSGALRKIVVDYFLKPYLLTLQEVF